MLYQPFNSGVEIKESNLCAYDENLKTTEDCEVKQWILLKLFHSAFVLYFALFGNAKIDGCDDPSCIF